jgi:ABC-type nickel/cobalt efflux system permease component RcnA
MRITRLCAVALGGIAAIVTLSALANAPVWAQTPRNPFAVGGHEIGGSATGIAGWILAQQGALYLMISNAVRAAKQNGAAFWGLAAISFAYGVFHAAGPGHGKAVIASYMLANERALRRGLVISFLAALLQGTVAVALIGVLAIILHATAQAMNDAAAKIDMVSFAGIACLGLWLVFAKGTALRIAWRQRKIHPLETRTSGRTPVSASVADPAPHPQTPTTRDEPIAHCGHCDEADATGMPKSVAHYHHHHHADSHSHDHAHHSPGETALAHGAECGHFHAPDPSTLNANFSWRTAIMTLAAAGSRPCAGAILVLVFALSQGIFWAGVGATFAMSLGTAITTGALASVAVLAKNVARRIAGAASTRGELALRGLEFAAALLVFVFGFGLLFGVLEYGA